MNTQPEALRLAQELDAHQFDEPHAAAAELLRLHAQRDVLLEALKLAWPIIEAEMYRQNCSYGKNFSQTKVDRARAAHEKARAALAQPAPEPECTWHQDGDSDSGVYATSCGHYFNLEDGTPEDNKMSWCCYCGKKLAQELITEGGDD